MCPGDRNKLNNIKADFSTTQTGYNIPNNVGGNSGGTYPTYTQTTVVSGTATPQGKDNATSFTVGLQGDETQPNVMLSADRNFLTANAAVAPAQNPLANGRTSLMDQVIGQAAWITGNTTANQAAQHDASGNYALSDGSVQQGTSSSLTTQLRQSSASLGYNGLVTVFPL